MFQVFLLEFMISLLFSPLSMFFMISHQNSRFDITTKVMIFTFSYLKSWPWQFCTKNSWFWQFYQDSWFSRFYTRIQDFGKNFLHQNFRCFTFDTKIHDFHVFTLKFMILTISNPKLMILIISYHNLRSSHFHTRIHDFDNVAPKIHDFDIFLPKFSRF